MLRPLQFVLGILCLAFAAGAASPDSPFSVDSWGNGQGGLPDNEVLAMVRSHNGYLWLGTLHGLVRFDGVQFTVYDESNTRGLQSMQILRLFQDSHDRLWVGFGGQAAGVALIAGGHVQQVDFAGGQRSSRVVSMCEDSTGAVWLLTKDGKLGHCVDGTVTAAWRIYTVNASSVIQEPGGLLWLGTDSELAAVDPRAVQPHGDLPVVYGPAPMRVDLLLASRAGGYWRLADGRIGKYAGTNLLQDLGPYPWRQPPNQDLVLTACEDRDGNLVVGTGGNNGQGIFWFDKEGRATHVTDKDGLSNNSVYSLTADGDGNLWAGFDGGGLNRVSRRVFKLLNAMHGAVAESLCPDNQGGVWIGAKFRNFSYWSNGAVRQSESFPWSISQLNPTAVLVDREQRVWGATFGAGLFALSGAAFHPALSIPMAQSEVSVLFEDKAGTLWAGTSSGLAHWNGSQWEVFTTTNGLSGNSVHAIAEDQTGDLWVGTERGLDRLHQGKSSVALANDTISALEMDAEGVLWVGTQGDGLIRYHNGEATRFTTANGLAGNSIDYIIEDGTGFLWLGSNQGLMRARKRDLDGDAGEADPFLTCRRYDARDGLPATECSFYAQPAACQTSDGTLWFPTVGGVVSVKPRELPSNTNPPPVVIESILVDGKLQGSGGPLAAAPAEVNIPAGKEDLEIQYTSLNLAGAPRTRFQYRLEGHETKWREAGGRRFARYPTLPPNHYRFQVRACNEDGVWNYTGASLAVTMEPFFWQTWAFRAALAAVLIGAVAASVHFFSTQKLSRELAAVRQQQALDKERTRIARDIHDQVGASLTQLALLGEMVEADKDCPEEAEEHARQISQTARDTTRALDEIVWTVNPSNDTLDGLVNYICKEAQDHLSIAGLRYRLDIPAVLPPAVISPETRHNVFLAARESVNNIVKHARATEVCLRLELSPGAFALEIEDNGRGPGGMREKAAESRNGLRNMRKRLEDIGGEFSIGPAAKGGTLVRLTVPLARN